MFTGIRRLYIPERKKASTCLVSSWIVNFELEDRQSDVASLFCPGSNVIHVFHTEVQPKSGPPERNITRIVYHPAMGGDPMEVDPVGAKARWNGTVSFVIYFKFCFQVSS